MHIYDEFCEIHLDANLAPHCWLFRADEPICVQFGVRLDKQPTQGMLWVETNNGCGYHDQRLIHAEPVSVDVVGIPNGLYQFYIATLPLISQGGYHYRLAYCDQRGEVQTCRQSRAVFVDDDAPRSLADIDHSFLGIIHGKSLYGPKPQVVMTPSPQNWSQRLFYSLIIDRFAHTEHNHRHDLGWVRYDPTTPVASHGGTIAGITQKLSYLKALGVGVIMLSPVYVNDEMGYHGYHPLHLMMVDPRLGTLADLRAFVAQAHALGIAVILDVVNNHLPNLIDWEKFGGPPGGEFKYIRGHKTAVLPYPIEARNTMFFHDADHTDMIKGRLFDFLEDWRTETPYVRALLIQHLKYWMANTDIDGFRYDAVRHVGADFWEDCLAEIDRYAHYLGKTNFLQIAEHAGYTHQEVAPYHRIRFTNFLDYPTYFGLQKSWDQDDGLQALADYCCGFLEPDLPYRNGWHNNLMFLDNHDRTRVLHQILHRYPQQGTTRTVLHLALACLLLGPQPPVLYYGTEQEFDGALGIYHNEEMDASFGHDHYVREDMFPNPDCTWKFGPINRPHFPPYSTEQATFQWIHHLATIRMQLGVSASRHCIEIEPQSTVKTPRVLLLETIHQSQPLLFVLNPSDRPLQHREVVIPANYGVFRRIQPLATTGAELNLQHNKLHLCLPPFGIAIGQLLDV
ncbi:MAG: alpha-amylase family glycosyl hydrolase [Chloroflexota bacterium]